MHTYNHIYMQADRQKQRNISPVIHTYIANTHTQTGLMTTIQTYLRQVDRQANGHA